MYFSPQDTESSGSTFSESNKSQLDAPVSKKEAKESPPSLHCSGWDKGIVKLRKAFNMNPDVGTHSTDKARDSVDTESDITWSTRDSGETVVEDLP